MRGERGVVTPVVAAVITALGVLVAALAWTAERSASEVSACRDVCQARNAADAAVERLKPYLMDDPYCLEENWESVRPSIVADPVGDGRIADVAVAVHGPGGSEYPVTVAVTAVGECNGVVRTVYSVLSVGRTQSIMPNPMQAGGYSRGIKIAGTDLRVWPGPVSDDGDVYCAGSFDANHWYEDGAGSPRRVFVAAGDVTEDPFVRGEVFANGSVSSGTETDPPGWVYPYADVAFPTEAEVGERLAAALDAWKAEAQEAGKYSSGQSNYQLSASQLMGMSGTYYYDGNLTIMLPFDTTVEIPNRIVVCARTISVGHGYVPPTGGGVTVIDAEGLSLVAESRIMFQPPSGFNAPHTNYYTTYSFGVLMAEKICESCGWLHGRATIKAVEELAVEKIYSYTEPTRSMFRYFIEHVQNDDAEPPVIPLSKHPVTVVSRREV